MACDPRSLRRPGKPSRVSHTAAVPSLISCQDLLPWLCHSPTSATPLPKCGASPNRQDSNRRCHTEGVGVGADDEAIPVATSARLSSMAFGQQSGPQASAMQMRELLTLLKGAGYTDLRDARGSMGFTQRQAAGKFTRDEATAFIDRLQDAEFNGSTPVTAPAWRLSAQEQMLHQMSAEQLAVELRRRGWTVTEP